ncbi:MAG: hypothetical protein PQJ58_09860 [Spirochaetales bacterium]|nr:hypothetical protein [Spirochaetales bacterium]
MTCIISNKTLCEYADYRKQFVSPLSRDEISIRLIPYYAWSNRGLHDMSVWLKMCS